MVINLMSTDPTPLRFFEHLIGSMLDYYQIPRTPSAYMTMSNPDQIDKVCVWLNKHKQLTVTAFRFENRTQVLAHGIEIEPSPFLSRELLKMQSDTVDSQ